MARSPTTADAFTAIAEPRRRELLGVLASGQRTAAGRGLTPFGKPVDPDGKDVTWIVEQLGWPQPQVSKHLAVLREVGLVSVVRKGRRRMYSLDAENLRPVYEWVKTYERFWEHQLQRIKSRAEQLESDGQRPRPAPHSSTPPRRHPQ